jgi:hypothetical protein
MLEALTRVRAAIDLESLLAESLCTGEAHALFVIDDQQLAVLGHGALIAGK